MNYTVDTINKTITLHESCNVAVFILELQANLKNWEEYTIITNTYHTLNPYIISPYPTYPSYPIYTTGSTATANTSITY